MKSILVDNNNIVKDIVEQGNEFEVHPSLTWKTTETEVTANDMWQLKDDGTCTNLYLEAARTDIGAYSRFKKARTVSYGDVGEQLGMLYNDMQNGTTEWVDKIAKIKKDIPKVDMPDSLSKSAIVVPPVHI